MRFAGVVLAGGASRRMGRTKALIDIDGRAMADRVLDALRTVGADPVMVVGGDVDALAVLSAPHVADRFPGEGPVGGVLTALEHLAADRGDAPIDAALVLACDLADITADALRPLVDDAERDARSRVWVAATERMEPMCALWSIRSRAVVRERFVAGERALHRVIAELPHTTVTVDARALRNVNRPDDLSGRESER